MPETEVDFVPLWDYVLIDPIKKDVTEGGIQLPEGHKDKGELGMGRVIKSGKGAYRESGAFIPNPIQEGDLIYMMGHSIPFIVNLKGKKYLCLAGRDVVAIAGRKERALPCCPPDVGCPGNDQAESSK